MNAQRYHVMTHTPPIERVADSEGLYVLYSDYSSLQAKHDRAIAALQKIAAGEGYYGAMAAEYKTIAKQVLADEVTDERPSLARRKT